MQYLYKHYILLLCVSVCAQSLSCVWLFAAPWIVALQVPLSMGFPRPGYWNRVPFPSPEDLPDPGTEPMSLTSPALVGSSFTTTGK